MEFNKRFENALSSSDPVEMLRNLVFELSSDGFDRASILEIFEKQRQRLHSAQRESDEDAVMDVMDFLVGWCSPHMKLLSDEPDTVPAIQIHLEPDVAEFIRNYARENDLKTDTVVNQWLRKDIAALQG